MFYSFKKCGVLLYFFCMLGFAQTSSSVISGLTDQTTRISNSQTSGMFRVFGEFPASNFIGVTDVNIPVHTLQTKQGEIPIAMKYHNGMGNKIESTPGILGLGWHLDVGGAITLIESRKGPITKNELVEVVDNVLNNPNWSTKSFLESLMGTKEGDKRKVMSNTEGESLQRTVYAVNFDGYSGELYFDVEEQPQFRSKQNVAFQVKVTRKPNILTTLRPNPKNPAVIDTIHHDLGFLINKFILTNPKGIQYEFGDDDTHKSIEYTRKGHLAFKTGYEPKIHYPEQTTWNLTKIIYPNNDFVQFKYEKEGYTYQTKVWTDAKRDDWKTFSHFVSLFQQSNVFLNREQASLIDLVYLTEIITNNEKIQFFYKKYSQPTFTFRGYDSWKNSQNVSGTIEGCVEHMVKMKNNFFFNYPDVGMKNFFDFMDPIKQLDYIKVLDNEEKENKKVKFDYFTFNTSVALRLKFHCPTAQFTPISEGGIPYCFLKAVEKWEGFLNPTSQ